MIKQIKSLNDFLVLNTFVYTDITTHFLHPCIEAKHNCKTEYRAGVLPLIALLAEVAQIQLATNAKKKDVKMKVEMIKICKTYDWDGLFFSALGWCILAKAFIRA